MVRNNAGWKFGTGDESWSPGLDAEQKHILGEKYI